MNPKYEEKPPALFLPSDSDNESNILSIPVPDNDVAMNTQEQDDELTGFV